MTFAAVRCACGAAVLLVLGAIASGFRRERVTHAIGRAVPVYLGVLTTLLAAVMTVAVAQRRSLIEGPWSGQAQCTVVAKGADYQDEQTHTWRLTGAAPTLNGSYDVWPRFVIFNYALPIEGTEVALRLNLPGPSYLNGTFTW